MTVFAFDAYDRATESSHQQALDRAAKQAQREAFLMQQLAEDFVEACDGKKQWLPYVERAVVKGHPDRVLEQHIGEAVHDVLEYDHILAMQMKLLLSPTEENCMAFKVAMGAQYARIWAPLIAEVEAANA